MTPTLLMERGFDGRDGGGFFFFLLTLALFGTAAYFLIRAIRRRRGWDGDRPDSRRILDERFARGEIDRSEYEHRKAVLDGDDVIPPAPATAAAATGSASATSAATTPPASSPPTGTPPADTPPTGTADDTPPETPREPNDG
ncbi:MAG: SHOCT domain-containing protein [Actinomycetota bacterium]